MLRIGRKINGELSDWAVIDPTRPQVIVILGKRGAGKTFTTSVIIEELLLSEHDIAVVVFDPVSVYFGLKEPSEWSPDMKDFEIEPLGFKDQVRVFVPGDAVKSFDEEEYDGVLKFKPSTLELDTWMDALKIPLKSPMAGLLERALSYLRDTKKDFTVDDIADSLDVPVVARDFSYSKMSIGALRQRLYTAKRMNLFSDEGFSISEIAKPKMCTIIDTSRSSEIASRLVVSAVCHEINEKRKDVVRKLRKGIELSEKEKVPPIWLIVEEAHNYLGRREVRHVEELARYIRESRNFGCSLVAISQQPSQLYTTAVSQHDILIIHNLVSGSDIKEALHIVPSEVHISANMIRMLKPGEAIFISGVEKSFMKIKVRPRMSKHVAETSILVTPIVDEDAVMSGEVKKELEDLKKILKDLTQRIEEINISLSHRIDMLEEEFSKSFVKKSELGDLLIRVFENEKIDETNRVIFAAKRVFDQICRLCDLSPDVRDTVTWVLMMKDKDKIDVGEVLSGKYMLLALERLSSLGILRKEEYAYIKDMRSFAKATLEKILDHVENRDVELFIKTLDKWVRLKLFLPEITDVLNQLEEPSD